MTQSSSQNTIDALNRLLTIHYRSLPMYLIEAVPWVHAGDERASAALADVVESHREIVRRLADEIQQRGGVVDPGEYPADFPDLHFLSLDYLLCEIVTALDRDIEAIRHCAARLEHDRVARALAEEALGTARGHRQTMQELVASPALRT